jgi:aromatic-L-amino-acid decarboxylase
MDETKDLHMTPDELRRCGREAIDWIARYQERVEGLPVRAQVRPGEIRSQLPPDPPRTGEPFGSVLEDLDRVILPGITHWQSPNFFAYFPSNISGPSILGELLCAGLGVQGMLWATSPACTELETHVLDWLVGMLGLPERFLSSSAGGGVIQDTASSASLCALLAGRERATGWRTNDEGCDGRLVAYASTQAHSSIEKAVRIAGLGTRNLRMIEVDADFRMKRDALERAIDEDRSAGLVPCCVFATIGTTSSLAIDPVRSIGSICRDRGIWLHVDGAMAGTAALCPEHRWIHDGLELADSYCFNPHKWMFTNFDCDCFWVADRAALVRTLSVLPEYLRNRATESGAVIDYRDWHIPLGRRFRSLKLWMVIRHYGVDGLQALVRRHIHLAELFRYLIENDDRFEIAADPSLNLVCFRHRDGDETTMRIMESLNDGGSIYLTHTKLGGRAAMRLCVGQANTEERHVRRAYELIAEAAERIESGGK